MSATTVRRFHRVHSLDRYRPLLQCMQVALFVVGVFFWVDANLGASGFSPTTWGQWAYQFPAEAWAFVNMAAAALTLIGIIRPTKRHMVVIGGSLHVAQMGLLAYSAAFTGGDMAIALYASNFFLPLHLWMVWEAAFNERDYHSDY